MKILILGCGWVGESLVSFLVEKGNVVHCTTTTEDRISELEKLGAKAYLINFDEDVIFEDLDAEYDYVLTSVPASSKNNDQIIHTRFNGVARLLNTLHYQKHIYLSSIGIYPDIDFVFDEKYVIDKNQRLAIAENILKNLPNTIVYRLGGLFGKNRIFAKYFANRVCTTGDQPANFVHIDDVIKLIVKGFEKLKTNDIYNVVAPEHPSKREVILASAKKYGFDLPSVFIPENSFQKVVEGEKIIKEINYTYKYPSPLNF